jgi:transcriptional regulator with XRE-family HTH domain
MNRLKELRQSKKKTQQELADIVGVTKRTYIYWEQGERQIKREKAIQLAKFFNVSLGYLLGYVNRYEPYYSDEIFIGDGKGGYTSLSSERDEELRKLFYKHVEEKFTDFLKSFDFVITDNEIKAVLSLISNLNINNYESDEFSRLVNPVMEDKINLKYMGYSKLGEGFYSWKAYENFKKSLGIDTDHTL